MSPDRVFISFIPPPLSQSLFVCMYLTHSHYTISTSALPALLLSNTRSSLHASFDRSLSFILQSLHLSLFTAPLPLLEVNGWFQYVRAEWLITVEDRGGCSLYQHHLYSAHSAAPQFASFLSFLFGTLPLVILFMLFLCFVKKYSTNINNRKSLLPRTWNL